MPKFQDLTGQKFSRLTVIELDKSSKNIRWLCKCDCGTIKSILPGNLKTGDIKSCGCLNKSYEDFTGRKYGRLTVIERDYTKNRVHWLCICECGTKKSVGASDLKRGDSTSCGCLKSEVTIERNRVKEDLTGQVFTRLKVLSRVLIGKNKTLTRWECLCDCGNIVNVSTSKLKTGHTRSCGCLQVEKFKEIVTKHGLRNNKGYDIWCSIKERCFNSNTKQYNDYGGRGITLHEEWINNPKDFIEYVSKLENFGEIGYSIDRVDNDGNYEPGNLRWATHEQQVQNTRRNVLNPEIVREIRNYYKDYGGTYREVSELFDISIHNISGVLSNKTWKNII